jgi:hypothetical protein
MAYFHVLVEWPKAAAGTQPWLILMEGEDEDDVRAQVLESVGEDGGEIVSIEPAPAP